VWSVLRSWALPPSAATAANRPFWFFLPFEGAMVSIAPFLF
jgi:hypothetical protein